MLKRLKGFILPILLVILLSACGNDEVEPGKIVVTGKEFTEQIILTHLLAEYIDANTDMDVEVREALGGVFVIHEAMKQGDVDLYIEYTGTGYENVLNHSYDPNMTPDQIYEETKEGYEEEFNITWLESLGFNNTYALAVRSELAEELNLETYTDLAEHAENLSFGTDSEFFERSDGYDALAEAYGYEFDQTVNIDPDLMYQAARNADIDVIAAFATDARIDQYELKVLEDDLSFFPPYYAAPVIRQEVLDANPGLEDLLNDLAGILDDDTMRALNGQVNLDGKLDRDVAIEFLQSEGLID